MNSALVNKSTKSVTSYDLLKSLALLLMLVDHIGVYFFPDVIEYRLVGRLSAPIWLFLIGYARSRGDILKLFSAGVIAQISYGLMFADWFYFDILFLMLLARYFLDDLMRYLLVSQRRFIIMAIVIALLSVPTGLVIMYGTLGLGFVIYGYLARYRQDHKNVNDGFIAGYAVFLIVTYAFYNLIVFSGLPDYGLNFLIVGGAAIALVGALFRPAAFPLFDHSALRLLKWPLKIMGRYTLEFYVIHLIAFRVVSYLFVMPQFLF